ncbi:hypothetical protein QVE09_28355 [Paenibacillus sp. ClWae2A]|uniref:hypothetical protein n=1 Tax=Paenibacillus sp. ClWae2A TaxID=3057177 RepID=UPI0028F6B540|nr:hypothetical protein [Paenibacillus sp. ClWae2A]MDT9722812.1 hypothetical protein [Paenibacillus sp. ClWae2A]
MKLIKLKGSKTEEDIRRELVGSHESLFNDEIRSGLLSVIKRFFPQMKTAYILFWTPEHGEDIFSLLINNDRIAKVEIDRYDQDIEPIIESKQLDNVYLKGLRKYSQIRLAIALELVNMDLQEEEKIKGVSELKNQKRLIILLFLLIILALTGCNSNSVKTDGIVEDGLNINSISIGLGGSEEDEGITVVTYHFNLWNRTNKSIILKTVEPIISNGIQERLMDRDIKLDINKKVDGNTSEALTGTFKLDTKGLDKEGIIKLNINVKEFNIAFEQVIGINEP